VTLEDDLRRAGASLRTTDVDTPPFGVLQRKHRLRVATITAAAVMVLLAASGGIALAARNPHHGVNVATAPGSSIPSDVTSTSTSMGGTTPLVSGTVTFGSLKSGDTLPLGTIASVDATIRNNSDHSIALVHDEAAVFALTCDNGQLDADPSMRPRFFPFASTYTEPGDVNITRPLAAGQSFSTSTSVTGRAVGTMTCRIVVNGNDGWSSIDPRASASLEIVPAIASTTTP
jgi:hypothetical protein